MKAGCVNVIGIRMGWPIVAIGMMLGSEVVSGVFELGKFWAELHVIAPIKAGMKQDLSDTDSERDLKQYCFKHPAAKYCAAHPELTSGRETK